MLGQAGQSKATEGITGPPTAMSVHEPLACRLAGARTGDDGSAAPASSDHLRPANRRAGGALTPLADGGCRTALRGGVFIALGVAAILLGRGYPDGSTTNMGPGYFPDVAAGLLIFFGFANGVAALRSDITAARKETAGSCRWFW